MAIKETSLPLLSIAGVSPRPNSCEYSLNVVTVIHAEGQSKGGNRGECVEGGTKTWLLKESTLPW